MKYLFGDHQVDLARRELTREGAPIGLEPQTYELLTFLLKHNDRAVSKEEIFEAVWGGRAISDGVLTTRMRSLRRAIDLDKKSSHIKTLHRVGYRFDTPVQIIESEIDKRETVSNSKPDDTKNRTQANSDAVVQPNSIPGSSNATLSGKPSIAILPLDNMSDDPNQIFFSDGMSENILTVLSRFDEISVVARNSSFSFRGQNLTIPEIGQKLGVLYVLEGSVRRSENRVRITAQLIDAVEDVHIWSGKYDRDLEDIFAVQDEVTQAIVLTLLSHISLNERQRVKRMPPKNLGAWENYQLGLAETQSYTSVPLEAEIEYFEEAIRLDPNFVDAHAELAISYSILSNQSSLITDRYDARQRAMLLAKRAVDLNGRSPKAWVAQARVKLLIGDTEGAVAAGEKAVEMNSNSALANYILGNAIWQSGQPAKAIEVLNTALALDPSEWLNSATNGVMSCALVMLGKYEEALVHVRRAQSATESGIFSSSLGELSALGHLGHTEKAREAMLRAQLMNQKFGASNTVSLDDVERAYPINASAEKDHFFDGLLKAGVTKGDEFAPQPGTSKDDDGTVLVGRPSIAILPLKNMSGDADQDFFSDGMSEDILAELSRFKEFSVIARNSSFAIHDRKLTVPEIGQKLGAKYVLEGSVRWSDRRVRITAQLIDADEDSHVWAEKYDRDIENLFAVQNEVTHAIVSALLPHLS